MTATQARDQASDNDQTPPPVHHVYDGIEEQDNHLPDWWLGILFGSIIFAFGYWFVFETTHAAPGPAEEYRVQAALLAKQRAEAGPVTDEALTVLSHDTATLAEGQRTFSTMCAPCHGAQAQGQVGPNLTDKYWLHGAKPIDVHKSITGGYPDKGMPAWGPVLGPGRVRALAAFVLSIKGRELPGRPPQGVLVPGP